MRTIAQRIIDRASRPGGAPRFALVALVEHSQRQTARQRIDELVESGELFRFTRRPANGKGRDAQQYFTDAADGAAWAASMRIEPRKESVRKAARKAAYKAQPITISIKPAGPKLLEGEVIVPAGLRPKQLPGMPTFDARYQVDPATRVVGGFATLGPGRYLE